MVHMKGGLISTFRFARAFRRPVVCFARNPVRFDAQLLGVVDDEFHLPRNLATSSTGVLAIGARSLSLITTYASPISGDTTSILSCNDLLNRILFTIRLLQTGLPRGRDPTDGAYDFTFFFARISTCTRLVKRVTWRLFPGSAFHATSPDALVPRLVFRAVAPRQVSAMQPTASTGYRARNRPCNLPC